jgi:hypothetical protein
MFPFPHTRKHGRRKCVSNISIALYLRKHAFVSRLLLLLVPLVHTRGSCVLPLLDRLLLYLYLPILLSLLCLPTSHSSLPYAASYTQPARIIAPTADTKLPTITAHFPSLSRARAHQYNTSEYLRRVASQSHLSTGWPK